VGERSVHSTDACRPAGDSCATAGRPECASLSPMSLADPALTADAIEELYARGVPDGLPVVPPTRERVSRAVAATGRDGGELIALVPPNYGRATVEKIAVNAVMAGCRPEYLPVVVAAVEAVCDEAFDLHGVSATTNAPAPLGVVDQRSRAPEDLLATIAASMAVIEHHKMTHWGDTLLVLSPEHAALVGDARWTKADVRRWLWERLRRPVRELLPGRDGGDGLPEHVLRKFKDPAHDDTLVPKFRAPENIKILVAGGTAGRFSAIVPGWTFSKGSALVFRQIRPASLEDTP